MSLSGKNDLQRMPGICEQSLNLFQIVQNEVQGAEAMAIAEAGLNDALAQLRADLNWDDGFDEKSFADGTYSVTREDTQVTSVGRTAKGFVARIEADETVDSDGPPYAVDIDTIRVNE